jgi:hypothetical protein
VTEALGIVSLVAALLYGLWLTHQPPSWYRTLVKTLAVAALAGACLTSTGAPLLLVLALAFSALGDAFLAGDAKKWLQPGMAAFFVAHVLYVPLFLGYGTGLSEFGHLGWRLGAALGTLAVGALLVRWLWLSFGQMRFMVAFYIQLHPAPDPLAVHGRRGGLHGLGLHPGRAALQGRDGVRPAETGRFPDLVLVLGRPDGHRLAVRGVALKRRRPLARWGWD